MTQTDTQLQRQKSIEETIRRRRRCEECDEIELALQYCSNCDQKLCELHAQAHMKSKRGKHHILTALLQVNDKNDELCSEQQSIHHQLEETATTATTATTTTDQQINSSLYSFETVFGKAGIEEGEFRDPIDVAVHDNLIAVVDIHHHRIHLFDRSNNCQVIKVFGGKGYEHGQFTYPRGVTIHNQNIYICDCDNSRIEIYDTEGNYVNTIGGKKGRDVGQFLLPDNVFVYNDEIYVSERKGNRIQVFDMNGNYKRHFGTSGKENGQFDKPGPIHVDDQFVFVCDIGNNRIQLLDHDGNYVKSIEGDFDRPCGLTVLDHSRVFVSDYKHRVQVFDYHNHSVITEFGKEGSYNAQFKFPRGLVAFEDRIIICDTWNNRVQIWRENTNQQQQQ